MEKTAAGVYTNSPTGAVASTASTMEKQKGEMGGWWRGMLEAKWGEQLSLVGYSIGSKRNDRNEGLRDSTVHLKMEIYGDWWFFLKNNTISTRLSDHKVLCSRTLKVHNITVLPAFVSYSHNFNSNKYIGPKKIEIHNKRQKKKRAEYSFTVCRIWHFW